MPRRGFSLLELIVVLVIVGVVLAIALPRLTLTLDRSAVRAAAGDLSATFSTARRMAILRRAQVVVSIDTARASVRVRSAGRVISERRLRVPYGVVVGASRDSVVYDPRGLGFGLSNLTVTIRRGTIVDTLTMSRLGRVRW